MKCRVDSCPDKKVQFDERPGARCNARPVATGLVIWVCDWLRDETGLDFGDRSWICNATLVSTNYVPGSLNATKIGH